MVTIWSFFATLITSFSIWTMELLHMCFINYRELYTLGIQFKRHIAHGIYTTLYSRFAAWKILCAVSILQCVVMLAMHVVYAVS